MKPATRKARILLRKLEALAERGINGEKTAAQAKVARLKARFDFSAPDPDGPELFAGTFTAAYDGRRVFAFGPYEMNLAGAVKWAIENASRMRCYYRGNELWAEVTPATAARLSEIAGQVAGSFRALADQFSAFAGVTPSDRTLFLRGLYDGMMHDERQAGETLPPRPVSKVKAKGRRAKGEPAASLSVHPYTLAIGLGRQVRCCRPLDEIAAELEAVAPKPLAA